MRLRPYCPADAPAVRTICADTADYGRPIEAVFPDRFWVAEALTAYYRRFEPDLLWVAEDAAGAVAGYLCGCADTRRYLRRSAWRIAPRLAWLWVCRGHWRRPASWRYLRDVLRAGRVHGRVWLPLLAEYPAHAHINLRSDVRGGGVGRALWETLVAELQRRGIGGVHVSSGTPGGQAFFARQGLVRLAAHPGHASRPGLPPPEVWLMGKKIDKPAVSR